MSFHEKLEKILYIKEKEKEKAATEYQASVDEFEEVASKMYRLLTQKEAMEKEQTDKLSAGLPLRHMREWGTYLINLERSIHNYQGLVQDARSKMHHEEQMLLDKSIEVKKFEMLKKKRYELFIEEARGKENKLMDEISIQQYMKRGN